MTNYNDTIAQLNNTPQRSQHRQSLSMMQQGLEAIRYFQSDFHQDYLTNPHKTILIAGTNGKGTTAKTLASLLAAAGESVGLITSPHITDESERIQLNDDRISQHDFVTCYQHIKTCCHHLDLNYYEILTLMGVHFLTQQNTVDRLIVEVGLGGSFDCTNAIPHQFCIITSLGFDHQQFLGNSIEDIAKAKFGIVTKHATVIYGCLPEPTKSLIEETQASTQSTWIQAEKPRFDIQKKDSEPQYVLQSQYGKAPLNLLGQRAVENSLLALTAFEQLGYQPKKHLSTLENIDWPCRMSRLNTSSPCPIYLSGDHNPEGIQSLIEIIEHFDYEHLHILIGISQDKSPENMLTPLSQLNNTSLHLTQSPYNGLAIKQYGDWLQSAEHYDQSPKQALKYMLQHSGSNDLIVITGSLYLTGYFHSLSTDIILDF